MSDVLAGFGRKIDRRCGALRHTNVIEICEVVTNDRLMAARHRPRAVCLRVGRYRRLHVAKSAQTASDRTCVRYASDTFATRR